MDQTCQVFKTWQVSVDDRKGRLALLVILLILEIEKRSRIYYPASSSGVCPQFSR